MLKKIGAVACLAVAIMAIQAPVSLAAPTAKQPTVTLVPAFSNDLPIGDQSNSAGSPAKSTAATSAAAAPPFVCTTHTSDPTFAGSAISGYGSQDCSGTGWTPQQITMTIQKYKGVGIWNNLNKEPSIVSYNESLTKGIGVSCRGLGVQTYRIVGNYYVRNGAQSVVGQSANYLRVDCGG